MNDSIETEPFFIGWEGKAEPPVHRFLKRVTLTLIGLGIVIAVLVTAMQRTVTSGTFDFGNVRDFSGILMKTPVPLLVADSGEGEDRIFYLVAPLKRGFPTATAAEFHLQHVTLKGTLISDELESMIEALSDSVSATGASGSPLGESGGTEATVRGEIVDSKCYLGVMNPGRFKPHRACAIQCIQGGVPPIIVARSVDGTLAHYLMVGPDGSAINDVVIPFVAEPVEVTGILKEIGGRKVLYLDPANIKRL